MPETPQPAKLPFLQESEECWEVFPRGMRMCQLVPGCARASHTWTEMGGGLLVLCGGKDKLLLVWKLSWAPIGQDETWCGRQ